MLIVRLKARGAGRFGVQATLSQLLAETQLACRNSGVTATHMTVLSSGELLVLV